MTDNNKKSCSALINAYFTILIEGELPRWRTWVFIGPFSRRMREQLCYIGETVFFFCVLLTVYLSIILVINQLNAQSLVL